jgi:hypothetical protein
VNVFCAVSRLVSGPFFYTNALWLVVTVSVPRMANPVYILIIYLR